MAAQNEKLRVVVVGGVAGGASAAARVKRLNENADVVVFEKGSDVSFSNCGLPYYLSGTVEDSEDLIMMTPARLPSAIMPNLISGSLLSPQII